MADKLNYKNIAIQAAITALVIGMVNRIVPPNRGLGVTKNILLNLTLERMAQFADSGTMSNITNIEFLKRQFSSIDLTNADTYINGTPQQIANVAFVALHASDVKVREIAQNMMANYKKYTK